MRSNLAMRASACASEIESERKKEINKDIQTETYISENILNIPHSQSITNVTPKIKRQLLKYKLETKPERGNANMI